MIFTSLFKKIITSVVFTTFLLFVLDAQDPIPDISAVDTKQDSLNITADAIQDEDSGQLDSVAVITTPVEEDVKADSVKAQETGTISVPVEATRLVKSAEIVQPAGPFAEEENHFEFLSTLYASEAKQTGGLFGRFAASNEEVLKYRLKEYGSYLKIYFPEAYSDVVQNYIIQTHIQLQNWNAMEAELYKYLFLYPHSTIKESMLEKTLEVIRNERDLRKDSERITNNINEIPVIEDMAERYYHFLTKLSSMKRFQTSAIFRREAWDFLNRYSNTFYGGQVLVWLAENERVSENYQNAYALYDKILTLYPVNPEVVTALYSQGFLLQESFSEYENAISTYRQFLERFPNDSLNIDVQNRIATIYDRDLKDMENAITEYEVLAAQYTDSKKAMKGLMRMGDIQATELKQINEAIVTYNRVASTYAENQKISVKALTKAGELYVKAKDYEKAISQFMMVHYIYPGTTNDLEILERCATLYNKRLKNKNKAVETLNIIIEKFPGTKNAEKAQKLVKKLTK